MSFVVPAEIEAYAEAHTTPPSPHLEELAAETRARLQAPGMMVGALEGRFLELLVHASGARRVLEIGTFSGYSALSLAAGLGPEGIVITCDVNPEAVEMARRHIAASPYGGRIEVKLGPALETIATLDGPFDLVFIDADKTSYIDYYEAVLPKLGERGLIAIDNVLWSGRVLDPAAADADTKAIRALNAHVAADRRVVQVMLTVRDGVLLVRRADWTF